MNPNIFNNAIEVSECAVASYGVQLDFRWTYLYDGASLYKRFFDRSLSGEVFP